MSDILTHEAIRSIDHEEQLSSKLTKLPEDFFAKAGDYFARKAELLREKPDRNAEEGLRNTKRLVQDIVERRERKIMSLALYSVRTGIPPENLLPDERQFFDKILTELKAFRTARDGSLEAPKQLDTKIVAFLENVDAFIGEDARTCGPYKIGDIATIPIKNADTLIGMGKAEEVKAQ